MKTLIKMAVALILAFIMCLILSEAFSWIAFAILCLCGCYIAAHRNDFVEDPENRA